MNNIFKELFDLINLDKTQNLIDKIHEYVYSGYSINKTNEYGNTLLHLACRKRNYKLVNILLDNYEARIDIKNKDGKTPLHMAIIYGSNNIAYYLFKMADAENDINTSTNTIIKMMELSPHVLMMEDNDNKTPMYYYIQYSDILSNNSIQKIYKKYNMKVNFFNQIKDKNYNDYVLTLEIYYLINSQH